MISEAQFQKELELIISNAIREDVGDGDHSSLACIPASAQGKAKLLVKDEGIIAGVEFAKMIFHYVDKDMKVETFINDGERVKHGDVVFQTAVKQKNILLHDGYHIIQAFHRNVPQFAAVKEHFALIIAKITEQEPEHRGFAAAAATHKHHKLALINFQGDVLQRFALRAVIAEEKMIKNQCHIAPCS